MYAPRKSINSGPCVLYTDNLLFPVCSVMVGVSMIELSFLLEGLRVLRGSVG